MSTLNAKVILNVKTAAEWANSMDILLEGELGIESDTRLIKVGNGVDTYISLPYTAASDINDIEGVTVTSPTDGNVLTYSNGEWVNITPSSLPADTDLSHYDNSTSGFITASDIPALPADTDLSQYDNTNSDFATVSQIPTDVSQLNNDAGYITSSSIPSVGDGTITIQKNSVNVDSFTTNQNTNKTINITVPTLLSELSNDVGYITSATLPTVNDATLTIQRNGTTVGTFTANAATNSTINISVPTSFSDITSAGDLLPSIDATYNLGSSSKAWLTLYASQINGAGSSIETNGTIYPSVDEMDSLGGNVNKWSEIHTNDLLAYRDVYTDSLKAKTVGTSISFTSTSVAFNGDLSETELHLSPGSHGLFPTKYYIGSSSRAWDGIYADALYSDHLTTYAESSLTLHTDITLASDNTQQMGSTTVRFKNIFSRQFWTSDTTHIYSPLNDGKILNFEWRNASDASRTVSLTGDSFIPSSTSTIDMGSGSNRWNTIYYVTLNPPSDIRLKDNIEPLESGLSIVNDLDIKSFTFKNSPDHIEYGIIAQDVAEKYPELISVPDSEDGTYGTYLHNFIFASLRAIQELSSKVDELNAKIKVLEGRV